MVANKPVPLGEEDRLRLLSELRTLSVVAREAQDRMPKYLLLAAERGVEEFKELTGMISVVSVKTSTTPRGPLTLAQYSIIILVHQKAEQGVNVFSPNDVRKVQHQLNNLLVVANRIMDEYRTARGPEALERLFASLQPRPPGAAATAAAAAGGAALDPRDVRPPAPTQPVAVDQAGTPLNPAVAASLPKGLRVEDLKPPTAKRQKTAAAAAASKADSKSSPAVGGSAPTPETARTPAKTPNTGGGLDSPLAAGAAAAAASSSPAGKGKPAAKRKRQSGSVSKVKAEATAASAASAASMPPPAAPAIEANALGLEVPPHAEFFKARKDLETGQADVWAALADAVQEYTTAANTATAGTATGAVVDLTDDELFAQFMDLPQHTQQSFPAIPHVIDPALAASAVATAAPAAEWPTPELYHSRSGGAAVGAHGGDAGDVDGDDAAGTDTSPESIKTVGSTAGGVHHPPAASSAVTKGGAGGPGADRAGASSNGAVGLGIGRLSDDLLLPLSPITAAYNGGIFAWEDVDYDQAVM